MSDSRTSNKTELALRLGIGRNSLYAYLRLPGFPRPDRRGQWSIEACRKFISRQHGSRQAVPDEKRGLELELLRRRLYKTNLEIAVLDNTRTEEIANQITAECKAIIDALNGQLLRMPQELSGIFSQLGDPMPIFIRFKAELNKRFQAAYGGLKELKDTSRKKSNVVVFKAA
jgi:hypothetical protein